MVRWNGMVEWGAVCISRWGRCVWVGAVCEGMMELRFVVVGISVGAEHITRAILSRCTRALLSTR